MVSQLQRRYLELTIARQSNGAFEFDAGVAHGADEMLKRIDRVLDDAARPQTHQERLAEHLS